MKLRWEGETAYADREYVAALCEVSEMTVRRHCTPAMYEKRSGPGTGRAMYDVEQCAEALERVTPRPETTAAARRTHEAIARTKAMITTRNMVARRRSAGRQRAGSDDGER